MPDDTAQTAAAVSGEAEPKTPESLIDLASGDAFPVVDCPEKRRQELAGITNGSPTNVILFAGTSDCGKTTLLAALYSMLNKGNLGGYNFAGSQTLFGFERRAARIHCFRARAPEDRAKRFL